MTFRTDQEAFWAGRFGDEYIARNEGSALLASNLGLFSRALRRAGNVNSCLEFGANIGMNLRALKFLYPQMEQYGIEINSEAASILRDGIGAQRVFQGSIFDYAEADVADLVLIKGVLIHVNPEMLSITYRKLYAAARRWLLICEYYNPSPVSIAYRGHADRLYKRDFAGEVLDAFPDLMLVDYGFAYHRDTAFPQDDITWFLIEKAGR